MERDGTRERVALKVRVTDTVWETVGEALLLRAAETERVEVAHALPEGLSDRLGLADEEMVRLGGREVVGEIEAVAQNVPAAEMVGLKVPDGEVDLVAQSVVENEGEADDEVDAEIEPLKVPRCEKEGDMVFVTEPVRTAEPLAEFEASRVPEGVTDPLSSLLPDPDTEGVKILLGDALGEEENDTVAEVVDEPDGEADPLAVALAVPVLHIVEELDTLAVEVLLSHADKEAEIEPEGDSNADGVNTLLDDALGEGENETVADVVDEPDDEADPLAVALAVPVLHIVEELDTLAVEVLLSHADKEAEIEPEGDSNADGVNTLLDDALGEVENDTVADTEDELEREAVLRLVGDTDGDTEGEAVALLVEVPVEDTEPEPEWQPVPLIVTLGVPVPHGVEDPEGDAVALALEDSVEVLEEEEVALPMGDTVEIVVEEGSRDWEVEGLEESEGEGDCEGIMVGVAEPSNWEQLLLMLRDAFRMSFAPAWPNHTVPSRESAVW